MKCPTCPDSVLIMTDRKGVEIDYCPICRGVWLDRGELDKLMALSSDQLDVRQHNPQTASHQGPYGAPDFVDSDNRRVQGGHAYPQRRRKSWLSDIFD